MSAPFRIPYISPGSVNSNFDASFGVQVASGSTDAITIKEGTVFITASGVDALTLALPTAGLPSAGGDDGKILVIKCTTAHAHTVTTSADGINGADDIITFAGAVTNYIELRAYNGGWQTFGSVGVTLSELSGVTPPPASLPTPRYIPHQVPQFPIKEL